MASKIHFTVQLAACLALSFLCGCGQVGGSVGAPSLAHEDLDIFPLNNTVPRFKIIPNRVKLASNTRNSQNLIPAEDYLTAMLISALGRYQNFELIDPNYATPESNTQNGEGEFIKVQVLLTESDQFSNIEESGFDPWRYDSGWDYTWKPPITIVAFWVSMITGLPTVFTSTEVQGVVGIDVVATKLGTQEIVASFPVHGTHIERAEQIGNALFGASMKNEVRSTFAGASRAALSDAAEKLFKELKTHYGN